MNKGEISCKVKAGKSRQDATKYENGKEGNKRQGKKLTGQDVAEPFNALKVSQHAVKDGKDPSVEEKPCKGEEKSHPSSGVWASVETVSEAPHARL